MSRKKRKFDDDTFGQYISKDLEKYGENYGFDVVVDDFEYDVIDRGVGTYTELNATAYPKENDDIGIDIMYIEGNAGNWRGKVEVYAEYMSMIDIEEDNIEDLFKALREELDKVQEAGYKSIYTISEVSRAFSKVFDSFRYNSNYEIWEGFKKSHKYLADLPGIAGDFDSDYDGGASVIEDFIMGLPRNLRNDFHIEHGEKGFYSVYPKDSTLVK